MAVRIRYVNTASSSGNGTTNGESGATAAYASLSVAEAAEQADLVAAGDTLIIFCGVGSGSAADTTSVTFSGWTTGPSNYITIQANPSDTGGDQRAQMPWSGSLYRVSVESIATTLYGLRVDVPHTVVDGLQVEAYGTRNGGQTIYGMYAGVATDVVTFIGCIARSGTNHPTTSHPHNATALYSAPGGVVRSCVAVGRQPGAFQTTGNLFGLRAPSGGGGASLQNNTVVYEADCGGFMWGLSNTNAGDRVDNNLVDLRGHTGALATLAFNTSGGTGRTNASSDGTAWGTGSRTNQTFTFVDAAGGNYHLAASDAGAKDFGTDLSAEFSIDFDEETRVAPWDIGADEYISSFIDGEITKLASINIKLLSQITKDASISIKLVSEIIANSSINIYVPTIIDEYIPIEIDFLIEYLMNIDFELEELMNIEFTLSPEDDL